MPKAPHHRGDYQVRARRITEQAKANPATTCWRCGQTLDQHAAHRNGKRPWWTAGHVRDGDPSSPLAPEASTCNYRAGRAMQDVKRRVTSRTW